MKKILTLIGLMIIVACSVMIVSSCENTDWGEGDGDPSLLEFELSEDGTYYSVAGIGDYVGTHLVIPEEYKGLPVKEIRRGVFSASFLTIGDENKIELDAPWLKAITITNNITKIGYGSFSGSNIEQINIGSGISAIDRRAFTGTNNLKQINVSKKNQSYMTKKGVLYSKDGKKLIKYPEQKKDSSFRTPYKVIDIEEYAFVGAVNLKKVKIGNNVISIGEFAFFTTSIEEVKISDSVETVGLGAFEQCKQLSKVKLGSGLTEIAQEAFASCHKLKEIVIPKNIKTIRAAALCSGQLSKIFFDGTETEWNEVYLDTKLYGIMGKIDECPPFFETTQVYCYSKEKPSNDGNYWRYVFGVPTVWKN